MLRLLNTSVCPLPPFPGRQVSKLLVYSPTLRSTALDAMRHTFFDELRDPACRLPNGAPCPPACLPVCWPPC